MCRVFQCTVYGVVVVDLNVDLVWHCRPPRKTRIAATTSCAPAAMPWTRTLPSCCQSSGSTRRPAPRQSHCRLTDARCAAVCVFFTLGTALVKWKALSGVHVAQATSTEGNNSMAILNVGVSKGQATWEFTLDEDSQGGECTCFGAVSKPLVDFNYNSASAFMYRCYNGQLYGRNSASNKEKVRSRGAAVRECCLFVFFCLLGRRVGVVAARPGCVYVDRCFPAVSLDPPEGPCARGVRRRCRHHGVLRQRCVARRVLHGPTGRGTVPCRRLLLQRTLRIHRVAPAVGRRSCSCAGCPSSCNYRCVNSDRAHCFSQRHHDTCCGGGSRASCCGRVPPLLSLPRL